MTRRLNLLAVLTPVLLLTGCAESGMVARTRADLERGIPGARFDKELSLHFGRISTAILKPIARWAMSDGDGLSLRGIHRVDVAVYEVVGLPDVIDGSMLAGLEDRMDAGGWHRAVRTKEEGELTWIYHRENDEGEVRDLLVVALDDSEMVMVRVGGKVDRLLADAIADDPGGFSSSLGG